ncbi:hypothetical protein ABK040_011931 [Willaertia magna]
MNPLSFNLNNPNNINEEQPKTLLRLNTKLLENPTEDDMMIINDSNSSYGASTSSPMGNVPITLPYQSLPVGNSGEDNFKLISNSNYISPNPFQFNNNKRHSYSYKSSSGRSSSFNGGYNYPQFENTQLRAPIQNQQQVNFNFNQLLQQNQTSPQGSFPSNQMQYSPTASTTPISTKAFQRLSGSNNNSNTSSPKSSKFMLKSIDPEIMERLSPARKRSNSDPTPKTTKLKKKRSCARWTEEENKKLIEAYIKYEGKNWSSIAKAVGNKTSDQCNQHWWRVLNPEICKEPWSAEEDQVLLDKVQECGESSWKKVSQGLKGRTDLQCRHRWNQLKKLTKKQNLSSPKDLVQQEGQRQKSETNSGDIIPLNNYSTKLTDSLTIQPSETIVQQGNLILNEHYPTETVTLESGNATTINNLLQQDIRNPYQSSYQQPFHYPQNNYYHHQPAHYAISELHNLNTEQTNEEFFEPIITTAPQHHEDTAIDIDLLYNLIQNQRIMENRGNESELYEPTPDQLQHQLHHHHHYY